MPEETKVLTPYEHDCDRCVWVGWFHKQGGGKNGSNWGNMYFCPSDPTKDDFAETPGTILIRFSDQPDDYWSRGAGECIKGNIAVPLSHL